MRGRKQIFIAFGFMSIFILANVSRTAASTYVGVSVGDSFDYKYTHIQFSLKHNGTSYVNYLGNDIAGKTINIVVEDIYQSEEGSFMGYMYNRTVLNQTESFDNIQTETKSYLDYWLDLYFLIETAFNVTITNFNPEFYEFHTPEPGVEYNYTSLVGMPIFASTNDSMYRQIDEEGFPDENFIYMSQKEQSTNFKLIKESRISYVDGIFNVNVTNEETIGGDDWELSMLTKYEVEVDSSTGLVNVFSYGIFQKIVIDEIITETKTEISFEKVDSGQFTIDFDLVTPVIIISTLAIGIKLIRRKKK